jgi:hypothetical protein
LQIQVSDVGYRSTDKDKQRCVLALLAQVDTTMQCNISTETSDPPKTNFPVMDDNQYSAVNTLEYLADSDQFDTDMDDQNS